MKFGSREICDVVFKAKSDVKIGNSFFKKGQPVLYIDTAKTSTTEGAATTVYATGGTGNTRLIAWEGEKTLTFTVEDALLSPIGFAVLSGAGLFKGAKSETVHVHTTSTAYSSAGEIDLSDALAAGETICDTAPIFVLVAEADGSITGELVNGLTVSADGKKLTGAIEAGKMLFVDFYVMKKANTISELQIDAQNFAGYYYVEASTLFRRQIDGVDMPCELTFPNVKIQSNFTFNMAATGDPGTFTFTMDAMPGYTYFNPTRKVLCAMQIIEDASASVDNGVTVFGHDGDEVYEESKEDSTGSATEEYKAALNKNMPANIAKAMAQGATPFAGLPGAKNDLAVSAMQSADTRIASNGEVVGTLNHIDGFEAFSSVPELQDGYYFAVKLGDDMGTAGDTMTIEHVGGDTRTVAYDPDVVLRVVPGAEFVITNTVSGESVTFKFNETEFAQG